MFGKNPDRLVTKYEQNLSLFHGSGPRVWTVAGLVIFFVLIPLFASNYLLSGLLIPFLIFALAAVGLNLLMGYAGQVSFGAAAFMAIGAYASYNLILRIEWLPSLVAFGVAGLCAAGVGIIFGLPSLRVRGFYLAASTLATQFFVLWILTRFAWFSNYNASGVITAQSVAPLGFDLSTPVRRYMFILIVVTALTLLAINMVRMNTGRKWIAIRDMDVAAEIIGIDPLKSKLSAFAVSSFYCGVAGALYAFAYIGTVEPEVFGLTLSFQIMFMIIIGGLGSIEGAFFGAAFIFLLPFLVGRVLHIIEDMTQLRSLHNYSSVIENVIFGVLIVAFLVLEPRGLASLWRKTWASVRRWPLK